MSFFENIKKHEDSKLIEAYRSSGKNKYAEELVNRFFYLVFGVCLTYLKDKEKSKEAAFEIMEVFLFSIKTTEIKDIRAWLVVISRNKCLNIIRENKKINFVSIENENNINSTEKEDEEAEKDFIIAALSKTIELLNPQQKTCIELFYLRDKSYNDIMVETGLNYNEVKSHLQNGKRTLKILLEKQLKNQNHE